jgi:hypothetical protein
MGMDTLNCLLLSYLAAVEVEYEKGTQFFTKQTHVLAHELWIIPAS